MDQGYAIVVIQLPEGSSLARTDAVIQRATDIVRKTPGIANAVAFAGFSGATFTNASNSGVIFTPFESFEHRLETGQSADKIIGSLFGSLQSIQEAFIIALPPPPVRGIGNSGGFKMMLQDRNSADMRPILALANEIAAKANQTPGLTGVFTTFSASSPQFFLEIDRDKARMLNVPIPNIFETLSINLGTAYVNDFNAFGRVYQVRAQADQAFRLDRDDIVKLKVRSATGALVPLGTLVEYPRRDGAVSRATLQHVCLGAAARQRRARGLHRHGARPHGGDRGRNPAARHRLRMDGTGPPGAADRKHGDLHLRPLGAVRLPGACRAVRELDHAVRHRADRAAQRAGRASRRRLTGGSTTTSWSRSDWSSWSALPPRTPS